MDKNLLFGRWLTISELTDEADLPADTVKKAAMSEQNASTIHCNRCGTTHNKKDVQLPIGVYYCPDCITMGRARSDEFLYHLPQQPFEPQDALIWRGQLTPYQREISDRLVEAVHHRKQILVHAVTGAGKTEMIYAAVNETLKKGGTAAIASPRIDVCIELHKRLSGDFDLSIALLHGAGEPYFRTPLVIATTHQLLRFKAAFDTLIIDEVDAFPFADNDQLYYAAENSRKPDTTLIYLTATSTDKLDKRVKSGQLRKVALARRFHGNPLVVPQIRWHKAFTQAIKKQRQSGFPLLIFAPEISYGEAFAKQLQQQLPDEKIGFVASTTEDRLEIVEAFRAQTLSILVSTTILERGVTFPKVDVFVVDAQHQTFSKSALIQIAGRAGRSPDRPTGLVYFFHQGRTRAMLAAIAEIKQMNALGFSGKYQ